MDTIFIFQLIASAVIAYLLGSIPFAVIASKVAGKPDVRHHGSGNVGGTNAATVIGPMTGVAVVAADGLKGLFSWGVAYIIMGGSLWSLPLATTFAVIGHCWPLYLRFEGGLGLATAGTVILMVSYWTIAIAIPLWAFFYFVVFKKQYSPRSVILSLPIAALISIWLLPAIDDTPVQWLSLSYIEWTLVLLTGLLAYRHLHLWNKADR